MVKLVYYLDVMSSWCFYAEPALEAVRRVFGASLDYEWRIAWLANGGAWRYTPKQLAWYYRRSESISGVTLNPAHIQSTADGSRWPDLAAEAARALGATGDVVRHALAHAALIDGRHVEERDVALSIAAEAGGLDGAALAAKMDDPGIEARLRACAAEFDSLGATQRPTFVLRNDIGDFTVLSGNFRYEPLEACVRAMLDDEAGYRKFEAANEPLPLAVDYIPTAPRAG